MRFERRFTKDGQASYANIEFRHATSEIRNPDGTIVFRAENIEVPAQFSQVATDIWHKIFRKAGVPAVLKPVEENAVPSWLWRSEADTKALAKLPENQRYTGETSAKQVFDRLAGTWTYWGWKGGYFSDESDAMTYFDEMRHMLATQMAAPNSPQWFNTGMYWAYGIDGPSQGHFYVDFKSGKLTRSTGAYEHPQPHACFIQSVSDDLVNEGGIMDLWVREARLFKYGSGTGTNFSNLRGSSEGLSGGGQSSGLMSFLKIGDRAAGAIKSGGTTRRAAKMVVVDIDHPDIEEFIAAKSDSQKLRMFNLSVLVTDAFMEAVKKGEDWKLIYNNKVYSVIKAADLWDQIMRATYNFAEPGVIFIDRINETNNLSYCETITATNPCGEQPLPPYGACLLGSINLAKLVEHPFDKNAYLDVSQLEDLVFTAVRMMDNVIEVSQFPLEAQKLEAKNNVVLGWV